MIKRLSYILLIIVLQTLIHSCSDKEQLIKPKADFTCAVIEDNFTVPVGVKISNNSTGAQSYKWTFEGGSPSFSDKKDPGTVIFQQAGTHKIILEAWNDDAVDTYEYTLSLDSSVAIDFDVTALVNNSSPASFKILNQTKGASAFRWTFEGGSPASSGLEQPGTVVFTAPGEHSISLIASNGRKEFSISKTINVSPPLSCDFQIEPSFEDEDGEAPLNARLIATATGALSYSWSAQGGELKQAAEQQASVLFQLPGVYQVTLDVSNGKDSKRLTRSITVKPNSHLRTFSDVKLGISTAHGTIGSFFSTSLRRVLRASEVNSSNGRDIDLIFMGLNQSFVYNKFISPVDAGEYPFNSIPGARATKLVNLTELYSGAPSGLSAHFDEMQTDEWLRAITIEAQENKDLHFDKSVLPRIVLFENAAGYKGAVKIKRFVSDGEEGSYIVVDIKVQKD